MKIYVAFNSGGMCSHAWQVYQETKELFSEVGLEHNRAMQYNQLEMGIFSNKISNKSENHS